VKHTRIETDLCMMSASELSRKISSQQLKSLQVVDAFLDRIARLDSVLHSYVSVFEDGARAAAAHADRAIEAGKSKGPLHGLPIALKDLIELSGSVTTGGSAHYRDQRSTVTAHVAQHLLDQGMIVLGKTHTVEFAYGGWGTNEHLGAPVNPWDMSVHRVPGGSSSGSGVAVAGNLAPWALGTDTGGSVRLPAAFCGLVGLKTTAGLISTHGVMPLSITLDSVGPMTRSVEDAALLFSAMLPERARKHVSLMGESDITGLRFGRIHPAEREGINAEILKAYDDAIEVFRGLGAEIVEVTLPFALSSFSLKRTISEAEAYFIRGSLAEDANVVIDRDVRTRILKGKDITLPDYLSTRLLQAKHKAEVLAALKGVDAFLTPTTNEPPIVIRDAAPDGVPSNFTRFVNFCELCALARPDGFSSGGLPLSLQIVARPFDEDLTLSIGRAYQLATKWHLRQPMQEALTS
jgi:aspartyl-tRNA(Asn)/glutamyl-tRNA(Gln) amidotransferase subunit A